MARPITPVPIQPIRVSAGEIASIKQSVRDPREKGARQLSESLPALNWPIEDFSQHHSLANSLTTSKQLNNFCCGQLIFVNRFRITGSRGAGTVYRQIIKRLVRRWLFVVATAAAATAACRSGIGVFCWVLLFEAR